RAVTWLRRNRCLLPGITPLAYLVAEVRRGEQERRQAELQARYEREEKERRAAEARAAEARCRWAAASLVDSDVLVLDTETTGLDDDARIVELALLNSRGEVLLGDPQRRDGRSLPPE
ncbi:hypothetical protein AB0D37_44375, partial [Streptomyces sp. NPDC048384]